MTKYARMTNQRICVFGGSQVGKRPAYRQAAAALGRAMARRGLGLVYGGGSVGLMGVIADAVLEAGGEVIGVIPEFLATDELMHTGVRDMHVVPSMHARKARMAELSDAFLALPGGYGTLEELLEMITWAQLGVHAKPVGVLNVEGYFDALAALIEHGVAEGFIRPQHRRILLVGGDADRLLDVLVRRRAPAEPSRADVERT